MIRYSAASRCTVKLYEACDGSGDSWSKCWRGSWELLCYNPAPVKMYQVALSKRFIFRITLLINKLETLNFL